MNLESRVAFVKPANVRWYTKVRVMNHMDHMGHMNHMDHMITWATWMAAADMQVDTTTHQAISTCVLQGAQFLYARDVTPWMCCNLIHLSSSEWTNVQLLSDY